MSSINPDIKLPSEQVGMDKNSKGWLARLWGDHHNTPANIAALSIVLLLMTGILYSFFPPSTRSGTANLSVKEMWNIITPMITLALGYLFADMTAKRYPEPIKP